MEPIYSPKEIAVFDATLRLLSSGCELHALKISAIAAEAGIGKGTVYEYFDSKETLILRTLLYQMETEQTQTEQRVSATVGFKAAVFEVFAIVKESIANPMSLFRLVSSGLPTIQKLHTSLPQGNCALSDYLGRTDALVELILARGKEEGIVGAQIDHVFGMIALKAAIAAYVSPCLPKQTDEELRETAWTILAKALA